MVTIGSQGIHGTVVENAGQFLGCLVRKITAAIAKRPLIPPEKNAHTSSFRMSFITEVKTTATHERLITNKNTAKLALEPDNLLGSLDVLIFFLSKLVFCRFETSPKVYGYVSDSMEMNFSHWSVRSSLAALLYSTSSTPGW